jgi:hypothetical protein
MSLLKGLSHEIDFDNIDKNLRIMACISVLHLWLADPCHFGVDPDLDLDPRIHASD